MLTQLKVQVGDEELIITSLPATAAIRYAAKITKIVSGAGRGVKDIPTSAEEASEALHVGAMLQGIMANIDEDEATDLIKNIIRQSLLRPNFVDQSPQDFEDWFDDRFSKGLDQLMDLLQAIIAHNYGDPMVWLKKAMDRAMVSLASFGQSSPETSTEPSES